MPSSLIDRRRFLQHSSLAIAAVGGARHARFVRAADATPSADRLIVGKDARLIVHNADPFEIETPLALLAEHAITPKSLLFIRNNQDLPNTASLAPAVDDGWRVEFTGLTTKPGELTVGDLKKLDQAEEVVVVQCSGNGRAAFSKIAAAQGAPWDTGAMGNVRFRGVPLSAALRAVGVSPLDRAAFATAEGRDRPKKPAADFEHSIPLADALSRSLLALEMNGEPIPAVHGGPVRLITPGYYATMNVKWLGRLRFEAAETDNYHQIGRYRTPLAPLEPGAEFRSTRDNSEPNWRMRIKSVLYSPREGERVAAGPVDISGVAWNDGAVPLEAVLVSVDGGQSWRRAELKPATGPYAWRPFQARLGLEAGKRTLLARAVDAWGRTQPLSGRATWNPAGYAFNAVHAVTIDVV